MEYIRNCVMCNQEIIIHRKYPVTPSQQSELRKYCSICWGKRLMGQPAHHKRLEERYIDSQGYTRIKVNGIHFLEHRYIMEQIIGRKLTKDEVVHHLNNNKTDNSKENLTLLNDSAHKSYHSLIYNPRKKMF